MRICIVRRNSCLSFVSLTKELFVNGPDLRSTDSAAGIFNDEGARS
jgi:hypothetical protein